MNSLYRVLLLDDEAAARTSLRSCIDWEQAGYCIVAEASDGQTALELAERLAVDLVISDIVMPQMDGLTFIRQLKDRCPNALRVIVSGIESFEYAQRSMELQVAGYLLKPIDPSALSALLERCKHLLQQKNSLILERNRSRLNRIISVPPQPNTIPTIAGNNYMLLVSSVGQSCNFPPFTWLEQTIKQLTSQQQIPASNVIAFDIPRYPAIYAVMFHCENLSILSYHHLAKLLAKAVQTPSPYNPFPSNARIGVAYPFSAESSIPPAFKQAIKNLRMTPFLQTDIYTETVLARKTSQEFKDTLSSTSESIRLLMQNRKFEDVKKYLQTILCDQNTSQFTPSIANGLISLITGQLSLLIALYDFTALSHQVERLQSPIYLLQFENIAQLREDILGIIDQIALCFSQQNQDDLIRQIQKYLADSYASDWDLSELAALFYINSSYLSHIFKKKTGKTLSVYIEDLRIQNACALLRNSSIPIGEIAAAVGYSDPNYFAKRFRKKTGVSPVSYRKNQLANPDET